jgi:hypothetical protein
VGDNWCDRAGGADDRPSPEFGLHPTIRDVHDGWRTTGLPVVRCRWNACRDPRIDQRGGDLSRDFPTGPTGPAPAHGTCARPADRPTPNRCGGGGGRLGRHFASGAQVDFCANFRRRSRSGFSGLQPKELPADVENRACQASGAGRSARDGGNHASFPRVAQAMAGMCWSRAEHCLRRCGSRRASLTGRGTRRPRCGSIRSHRSRRAGTCQGRRGKLSEGTPPEGL